MKVTPKFNSAFTLTEVLIACAIFSMVVAGVLAMHVFGLKMSMVSGIKMNACEDGRTTIGQLIQDIHGAYKIDIGNGDLDSFSVIAEGVNQTGNAIRIFSSTNTASFVQYYYSEDNTLSRSDQASAKVVAHNVTNNITLAGATNVIQIFTQVDITGTQISTNNTTVSDSTPIRVFLKFLNPNPQVVVGKPKNPNFFDLDTIISTRK